MGFTHCVQLRLNRVGEIYDNGRRLSQLLRERILDLHHDGMSPQLITNEVKVVDTLCETFWGTMIKTTRLCPKWEKRNLDQNSGEM